MTLQSKNWNIPLDLRRCELCEDVVSLDLMGGTIVDVCDACEVYILEVNGGCFGDEPPDHDSYIKDECLWDACLKEIRGIRCDTDE